ncbi:helix-turn-helix domain-containing protein [Nocardia sp. CA-119907]|uniref:MmyB family transcriptional regulator n=1 Tax=Nocardia sp. CA-119907 TaxID=3239973 RepID=UPI003D95FFEC
MNRNTRSYSDRRRRPRACIPTLPDTLRLNRDHLRLSRVAAYKRHGISPSYLRQLEVGERVPSPETLDKVITGYGLSHEQARHIRELRYPAEDLTPTDSLRQSVREDNALRNHIQDLEERGVLAAYVDPMWNVLLATMEFRAGMPGLEESECIPVWLFSPIAKTVVIDWEREAAHSVATIKAVLGRYRDSEQAHHLLRKLRPNKTFHDLWISSCNVAYGRAASNPVHWIHPTSGEPTSYSLTVADVTQPQHIQLITALRKPYSGPPPH